MRKLFFWTHLAFGLSAGIVILIMSVTGVLLTYERQMIEWADRGYRSAPSGARMAPEALLTTVSEQIGAPPDALTMRSTPAAPAELNFGPRIVYADAYSGRVLGDGATGIRASSVSHGLAPMARSGKFRPDDRPRHHRRCQSVRLFLLALAYVSMAAPAMVVEQCAGCLAVSRRPEWQGSRLQLAQRNRNLVGDPAGTGNRGCAGDLVSVGDGTRVPRCGRAAAAGSGGREGRSKA